MDKLQPIEWAEWDNDDSTITKTQTSTWENNITGAATNSPSWKSMHSLINWKCVDPPDVPNKFVGVDSCLDNKGKVSF